jgi:ABC-2 type transport system permease protein
MSAAHTQPDARILDRGYRSYAGPRRGRSGAMRSVMLQSVLRVLGLRRSFWAKIVPTLTAFIAFVPAIVFLGVSILIPDELRGEIRTATYAEFYGNITIAIFLFTAFVGPEVLCPDRRTGMLGLYLASPLSRDTYLISKGAAVGSVLMIVTLGPALLQLIGFTILGEGPEDVSGFGLLLLRVVVSGVAIAALYACLSLAVSSVTTRHAVATASVIVILVASSIAANALVDAGADEHVMLFSLFELPFETVYRIYGEQSVSEESNLSDLSTAAVAGAYLAWTAGLAAFVRFRYQRLDVTR